MRQKQKSQLSFDHLGNACGLSSGRDRDETAPPGVRRAALKAEIAKERGEPIDDAVGPKMRAARRPNDRANGVLDPSQGFEGAAKIRMHRNATLAVSDANLGMLDDTPIVVPVEIEGDLDLIETKESTGGNVDGELAMTKGGLR